ncbi:hypothetical protein MSHOH_3301 [Methanosarcina horonobensis HB-1 = JCM 15518]|uniref:Schlafen AlbA-2 domain-containing protein n=2 Tax=Methanosarcina horonobensis TaxID=418008 RepID=A0A0E3SCR0_9EURY|nr:hypothetical protein MSHOH_3301 [Methanosarcina horonobensis HB-1 = JCM 15518]
MLSEVNYEDICKLKSQKIEESEILDYKKEYSEIKEHENNLLKEVTAFSNSSGGFLIYGVQESGKGGYPAAIDGIDDIDTDRLEQIIISNIIPRIGVKIKSINVPEKPGKIVLIIHIPEGQNQPYYNNRAKKFYKRYNFEATEMDAHEIEALYQKRFFGVGKLTKYVEDTIFSNRLLILTDNAFLMDTHIIITPLKVDKQIIDNSNLKELDFDRNKMRFEPKKEDIYLEGIGRPSRYGIRWISGYNHHNVEVHRNGLIHCMEDFGESQDGNKLLWTRGLAINLLQTIQFSEAVYSKLNFVGKVKIILKVKNAAGSVIPTGYNPSSYSAKCETDEIYIEREWDSWRLTEDYLEIGRSIIDEFSNYYGLWFNSLLFTEEEGKFVFRK